MFKMSPKSQIQVFSPHTSDVFTSSIEAHHIQLHTFVKHHGKFKSQSVEAGKLVVVEDGKEYKIEKEDGILILDVDANKMLVSGKYFENYDYEVGQKKLKFEIESKKQIQKKNLGIKEKNGRMESTADCMMKGKVKEKQNSFVALSVCQPIVRH